MWWWILGLIVIVALIGGAISTHHEDKMWEDFLKRAWKRITKKPEADSDNPAKPAQETAEIEKKHSAI